MRQGLIASDETGRLIHALGRLFNEKVEIKRAPWSVDSLDVRIFDRRALDVKSLDRWLIVYKDGACPEAGFDVAVSDFPDFYAKVVAAVEAATPLPAGAAQASELDELRRRVEVLETRLSWRSRIRRR